MIFRGNEKGFQTVSSETFDLLDPSRLEPDTHRINNQKKEPHLTYDPLNKESQPFRIGCSLASGRT
jgi:hypothetical protein